MSLTAQDYREMYEREKSLREEESQAQMDRFREDERRQQREYEESMRCADGWGDVWWKAKRLFKKEADQEIRDNLRYKNDPEWKQLHYFQDELAVIEATEEYYKKQMRDASPQIRRIREEADRQIAQIEKDIHTAVIAQVTAKHSPNHVVIQALEEDNPQLLLEW